MRLIGGLVFWDPARPVGAAHLKAMAARVPGAGKPRCATQGPVGIFAAEGLVGPESTEGAWAVADMDLTNLQELWEAAGLGQGEAGLLPALYAREGSAFVERLRGGFAIALWDRRERTLLLAADRFGIKRLHYVTDSRRTAFASRPTALLAAPGMECRVDPSAVFSYLNFGCIPAPASIFAGVKRVPPGHLILLPAGEGTATPYWDMTYPERRLRRADVAAETYRLAEKAVAEGLEGADPKAVGTFLSGGTDSSTVLGLAARLTGEQPNAFSIGFREERYDELGYARVAALHFRANHYTQTVTPEDALDVLPRLVEAFDEPFANNSAIGTVFCAQLARRCGVARLLAGDGGDEIFGGNERYCTDRIFGLYHRIPAALRGGLLEPTLFRLPNGGGGLLGRAQRYVRRANIPNPRRFYSYEFFFAQEGLRFLAPDFLAAIDVEGPYRIVQAHYDRAQAGTELNRLLYLDLKLTIGDNDLLKVTRTAEMADVAVRFPLLELPLVEFTGTWPPSLKVRGLEKRYLFKRAFRELLPSETLAKRKHGFGVPTSDWLKTHPGFAALARETLLAPRARHRGYFRPGAMEDLFRRHAEDATPYYGDILWTALMLELWHGRHCEREAAA